MWTIKLELKVDIIWIYYTRSVSYSQVSFIPCVRMHSTVHVLYLSIVACLLFPARSLEWKVRSPIDALSSESSLLYSSPQSSVFQSKMGPKMVVPNNGNLQSGTRFPGWSRRKEIRGKSTPDTFIWRADCQKSRMWTFIWLVVKQKKTTSQILIGYLAWGVISGREDCCSRAMDVESY